MGTTMQKMLNVITILAAATGLAGCGYTPEQRAVNGAAIGAGTGALIGAATHSGVGGVLAGSALGAATGAIIGANTRPAPPPPPPAYYPPPPPPPACMRWGYDPNGNPYCMRYYGS
jgi:hypothetical protein